MKSRLIRLLAGIYIVLGALTILKAAAAVEGILFGPEGSNAVGLGINSTVALAAGGVVLLYAARSLLRLHKRGADAKSASRGGKDVLFVAIGGVLILVMWRLGVFADVVEAVARGFTDGWREARQTHEARP